jgi:uncharacterized membrane protein YdcZ (DUF606 family)
MISIGTSLGLLAGLCLAGMRETRNRVVHSIKDIRAYAGVAVLGDIPLFERAATVRRRRLQSALAWSGGCLAGVVVMLSTVGYYYTTRG